MRKIKLLFAGVAMLFAILGLTRAVSYEMVMPIVFLCLAVTEFIAAKEHKESGEAKKARYFLLVGLIALIVPAAHVILLIRGR